METVTVGELTRYLRTRLEGDPELQQLVVEGEISNLTRHTSGHVYFTLKDEEAQIACAMFKGTAQRYAQSMPRQGDRVQVAGSISLYPPQGRYQLLVTGMKRAGEGDLHRRFLELKEKLEAEGLFEAERKRLLPRIPAVIGVVTSPTGAVIRDIVNTVRRRFPHVKILLSPAQVQGEGAAGTLIRAMERLQRRSGVDVIILARGGGSLEDLWCFNDEALVRAVAASPIPVVSGVGHETDFTLVDFAADKRASTPTAAAELAVPDVAEMRKFLVNCSAQLRRNLQHFIDYRRQMVDDFSARLAGAMQGQVEDLRRELTDALDSMQGVLEWSLSDKRHALDEAFSSLRHGAEKQLSRARHEIDLLEARLQALDWHDTLRRGFTLTTRKGQRITRAADLQPGETIETHFASGTVSAEVTEIKPDDKN